MLDPITVKCSDPLAGKQSQIITHLPPCLVVGIRHLSGYDVLVFVRSVLWPLCTLAPSVQRMLLHKYHVFTVCSDATLAASTFYMLTGGCGIRDAAHIGADWLTLTSHLVQVRKEECICSVEILSAAYMR